MKTSTTFYLGILMLAIFSFTIAKAQQTKEMKLTTEQQKAIKKLSLNDYKSFKASIKPLIAEMGVKKIVGLGEGTHGTAEFYKLRFWISRILIEEHGFNHIAFENDVTEMWELNQQLATADVNTLMRKYMIGIWQNEETKALLQWVKTYNAKHDRKVSIDGIDYPVLLPDVEMLKTLLLKANYDSLDPAIVNLTKAATMQDEAWFGMNKKGFKIDWKALAAIAKQGFITADSVETKLKSIDVTSNIKADLLMAVINLKQGFEPFYRNTPESARDSIMAYNTSQLIKNSNDKVIIWAHNAHLGKKPIYDGAVGGTGGYILKLFPNDYFVLGTGTAIGTFGGTTDARAVNTSVISPYALEQPIAGSWEELFSTAKESNFYFKPKSFNSKGEVKPLHVIGYGIKSGPSSYDKTNLTDIFDAFFFIKKTNSPTKLN